MPAVHFGTVQTCPSVFLDFPAPERVDCSIPSHAANHPLSTEHLPYLPAADCGCPPCRPFPAFLRLLQRLLRAEVPMSAFVCLRCLLPSRHSFGSPYTAIYLYAAVLASATNTTTGVGSGERQQTSAASVGILCHILYHDKRLGTARR